MKIAFTAQSSRLMYHMFCEPAALWQMPQQFTCSKLEEHDKFACVSRLVENKLMGPLGIGDLKTETAVAETLLSIVKKGDPKERGEAWKGVTNLLSRQFLSLTMGIKSEYVKFIKEVMTHYSNQKVIGGLSQGFSDLSRALEGHSPYDEDMLVDDEGEKAIEEDKEEDDEA